MTLFSSSSTSTTILLAVLLCFSSTTPATAASSSLWEKAWNCFHCPTSDQYDPLCLTNALPPWPICLFHDVDYFVAKAKDGATRCCVGDDLSECRCPKKDTPEFLDKIGDWCDGVQKCMPCDDTNTNNAEKCNHQGKKNDIQNKEEELLELSSSEDDCPTDDNYEPKCLESAIPPYPICLTHTVDEWVEKALGGHDDCCGDDLTTCKCPQKSSDKFASKIGDWCAGVETCM
jgi:hypothetical protein